jgi:hypothetical protein
LKQQQAIKNSRVADSARLAAISLNLPVVEIITVHSQ